MPKLTATQMPRVAMWLLTVLRMSQLMLTVLRMSWMMLTWLASGGNAAAALCCAECRIGLIPLVCRGMCAVEVVAACTGGIQMQ